MFNKVIIQLHIRIMRESVELIYMVAVNSTCLCFNLGIIYEQILKHNIPNRGVGAGERGSKDWELAAPAFLQRFRNSCIYSLEAKIHTLKTFCLVLLVKN